MNRLVKFWHRVAASERVSGNTEISLVSRIRNLWFGDIHSSEGAQGNVRCEDHEEQNHQLWAQVGFNLIETLLKYFSSVHITISCQMNFDDYPLDAHACQFQVGSCKYSFILSSTISLNSISDYDTQEVVMCKSRFIYDENRQRSLQHLIQIEELPMYFKTVHLPSGMFCWIT